MSSDIEQQHDFRELTIVEKTNMIEEIQQLATSEHEQLFKILKSYTTRYTENLNGVFINLEHVPNEALHKVRDVLTFWKDQKKHIEKSEIERIHIHSKPNTNHSNETLESSVVEHRDTSNHDPVGGNRENMESQKTSLFSEGITTPKLSAEQIRIIKGEKKKKNKKTHVKLKTQQILKSTTAQRVAKKCMKQDLNEQ